MVRDGGTGVVTSEPSGISCGTGLNICAADFARGSRVTLRADQDRFVAWRSDCEAGSGGTQLTCVVTMTADQTVRAEFRSPAASGRFTLSFAIEGPGSVGAGEIDCREESQPAGCSQELADGAQVSIRAFPTQNWLGSGQDATFVGWSGDSACTSLGSQLAGSIAMDHDVHCVAQFRAPNLHLLRITVSGAGVVTDDPPRNLPDAEFNCREGIVGDLCQSRSAATTTVPLRATPDLGQRFVSWGGDCASFGAGREIAVVVADNMECTATFEPEVATQTLTVVVARASARFVDSEPPGIHCSDAPGSDCSEAYTLGTEVVLHANVPAVIWVGCDAVTTAPVTGTTFCHVIIAQQGNLVSATFPPE